MAAKNARLRRLVREGWVQDQHGAWPMLIVPLLVGSLMSGPRPVHLLLAATWMIGYHVFHAAGLWRRTRRHAERVLPALATWSALTAVLGVPLLCWHPELLAWAPLFAPLVCVAAIYTWLRKDRALLSRASAIAASCLMVAVAAGLGSTPPTPAVTWLVTGFVMWHFFGTVPHVRSLVRAAGDPRWVAGACAWYALGTLALAALALRGWWVWPMLALALLLTARTLLVPWWQASRGRMNPMKLGVVETLLCVPLAVVAVVVGLH